jgi:CheY-like chemotaxis protein
MTAPTLVAVLGFTPFERHTLEDCLRLDEARPGGYRLEADPARAHFIVADTDDRELTGRLRRERLLGHAVAVGAKRRAGVLAQLARPLDPIQLLRTLDALPRPVLAPPPLADVERVLEELALRTRPLDGSVDVRAEAARGAPRKVPAPQPARAAAPEPSPVPTKLQLDHVLVVDDSEVVLRFMAGYLPRFGFQVHLARSGAEALERMRERRFDHVFIDIVMDGMDGFQVCKAIRAMPAAPGRPGRRGPMLLMLTSRDTAVDRLRAQMAGADAYLTKPLDEAALLAVIGDREIERAAYVDTAATTLY